MFIAQGMYVVLDYQPMVRMLCPNSSFLPAVSAASSFTVPGWHTTNTDTLCPGVHPASTSITHALNAYRHVLPMQWFAVAQGLEDHAYDVTRFVDAWAALWKQVSCLPNFQRDIANRVFVDIMNEPDSMEIRWEASGSRPGAHQLYLGTADALWALSPGKVLFMFEGAHHTARKCVAGAHAAGIPLCLPDEKGSA